MAENGQRSGIGSASGKPRPPAESTSKSSAPPIGPAAHSVAPAGFVGKSSPKPFAAKPPVAAPAAVKRAEPPVVNASPASIAPVAVVAPKVVAPEAVAPEVGAPEVGAPVVITPKPVAPAPGRAETAASVIAAPEAPAPIPAAPDVPAIVPTLVKTEAAQAASANTIPIPVPAPTLEPESASAYPQKIKEYAMTTTEEFVSLGQANVEAVIKSGQIWTTGFQDLTKTLAESAQAQFDHNVATWKALAGTKSIKEAFDIQSARARAAVEKAVADTGKITDASIKLAEQTMAPITARLNVAAEKFTKPGSLTVN